MTWITPSCGFFLLFVMVGSAPGQVPQPLNVSAVWMDDFTPGLSWTPPVNSPKSCNYRLSVRTTGSPDTDTETDISQTSPCWFPLTVMNGSVLVWSVVTVCDDGESEPVVLDASYTDVVKDFSCYLYQRNLAFCEWSPVKHPPDFGFYYRLRNEGDGSSSPLRECSSYNHTSGLKSGCTLQATDLDTILALFNGTLNKTLARNTFKKHLFQNVKPPPPTWKVEKSENGLSVTWEAPDINLAEDWSLSIKLRECNKERQFNNIKEKTHLIPLARPCKYDISVRAESPYGNTPWSSWRHYDNTDNSAVIWTCLIVIVPLVVAFMAALTCLCFRRNKEKIFPAVPEPRFLIGDILDNNNKSFVPNLYVQDEEEDHVKITLVVDPQVNKPDR